MAWKEFLGNVLEAAQSGVFFGYEGRRYVPGDGQVRVVPKNAALVVGIIEIAALVKELHIVGQCEKPVGKAGGDVDLVLLLRGEDNAGPLAEMRGAQADIHRNVQGLPAHHAAELGLRMIHLIVKSAESAFGRKGKVVLHERIADSDFSESALVICFQEKAAGIAEDFRPQFPDAGERCF